jgi:hypothetical protein
MRLAITCNGPGETAGWLTPLLHSLYAQAPSAGVFVFYVPDDYASGHEPSYVRQTFPQAHVFDPKTYLKVALGARRDDAPEGTDAVLYLGGDLMHAARLHKRFGGALATYKFARPRYARETARAFAVDGRNARELRSDGVLAERVSIVGNLAIDGALAQAALPVENDAPLDGVLFMPGSRSNEIEQLIPFFFTAALRMRREQPDLAVAFGISPFTSIDEVRRALERGGDRRMFAQRGALEEHAGVTYLCGQDGAQRFPVVRNAISAASRARLVVTIPGTKVIELAAIAKPMIACTPLNAPELVAINGPLTYLNRIPLLGAPLKAAAVTAYARRFTFHTQPNMDAQRSLVHELHGTLTPGRVARVVLDRLADEEWLHNSAQALGNLYREHVGASVRMASGLLKLCESR